SVSLCMVAFSFHDPSTTAFYTLSLHDALPIFQLGGRPLHFPRREGVVPRRVVDPWLTLAALSLTLVGKPVLPDGDPGPDERCPRDRKSTRLNSSHVKISYAVFCLKKKKQ